MTRKLRKRQARRDGGKPNRAAKEDQAVAPRDPKRPLWEPEKEDLPFVPAEVQQMLHQVLRPMYQRFVAGATDGLEQGLGMTLVHLMWLEVLEQYDLKRQYAQIDAVLKLPGCHGATMLRHLKVIDAKVKIGYLLTHLREHAKRWGGETLMPLDPPAIESDPAAPGGPQEHAGDQPKRLAPPARAALPAARPMPAIEEQRLPTPEMAPPAEAPFAAPIPWQAKVLQLFIDALEKAEQEAERKERRRKVTKQPKETRPRTPRGRSNHGKSKKR